nr:MAG TPA: Repressor protein CI [Bacteriophage sp.]
MINLGEWVRQARTSVNMTQEALGDELDMTKANISNMEKGKISPSFVNMIKIAKLTGAPLPLGDLQVENSIQLINNGANHGVQNNIGIGVQHGNLSPTPTVPRSGSLKREKMPDASMTPVLPENCELTIDTAPTAIVDGKIYQIQSGERFYIRRVYSQIDGSLKLVCENPNFENVSVNSESVQIVGRVISWTITD